jgi:hypothetical protein
MEKAAPAPYGEFFPFLTGSISDLLQIFGFGRGWACTTQLIVFNTG